MRNKSWNQYKLGELFDSRKEKGKANLPTLSVTLRNGLVDRESLDRKQETNLSPEEHLLAKKDDLVYNMMRMWQGASGRVISDSLVSPAYIVLTPKKELVDSYFSSYWFKAPHMIYQFWAYSYGLTEDRLRLYYNDFCLIKVTLPPLPEQKAIAETLSLWDEAIAKLERLIELKEKRFRWLLNELIGKKNKEAETKDNGWNKVKLGEVGEITIEKGKTITKESIELGSIPVVAGGQSYAYFTNSATHKFPTITVSASGANAGFVWYHDYPIWASDCNVIFSSKVDLKFLYYSLVAQQSKIYSLQSGGGQPHIYASDLYTLDIVLPNNSIQKEISNVLTDCEKERLYLSKILNSVKTQKQGLMQKLLTGKWRCKL